MDEEEIKEKEEEEEEGLTLYDCPLFPFRIGQKLFIGGSWGNRDFISKIFIEPAKKAGYIITHDWTKYEGPERRTLEIQRRIAALDYKGVQDADTVIFVMNKAPSFESAYRGTFCEIGIALGHKPVIIFNPTPDYERINNDYVTVPGFSENPHYWHPSIIHVYDLSMFPWLKYIPNEDE